jgi:tetratricopeptide (TPR) repeat protein
VEAGRDVGDSDPAIIDAMIRQLAHRVHTHMNQDELGTRAWRAVQHYTDGLREFRTAQKEEGYRKSGALRRAKQEFFLAYREDRRFVRSRYNLGVIYFSQRRYRPAYEAFEAAIRYSESPPILSSLSGAAKRYRLELASAHYAAAKAARGLNDQERLDHHRESAIELCPSHAGAWNLKGFGGDNRPISRSSPSVWAELQGFLCCRA